MKYSIKADDEFLRVSVSGRESDEPPSDVCKVVLMESRRLQRPRILIELDQKAPLSPVSQYQLVTRLRVPAQGASPPASSPARRRISISSRASRGRSRTWRIIAASRTR